MFERPWCFMGKRPKTKCPNIQLNFDLFTSPWAHRQKGLGEGRREGYVLNPFSNVGKLYEIHEITDKKIAYNKPIQFYTTIFPNGNRIHGVSVRKNIRRQINILWCRGGSANKINWSVWGLRWKNFNSGTYMSLVPGNKLVTLDSVSLQFSGGVLHSDLRVQYSDLYSYVVYRV